LQEGKQAMQIGFIGLGLMGSGMAANLQKGGHQLIVHDLTRQAASQHLQNGAIWAESPCAVAEGCDLVFTSLPTPADVERVGEELAAGFRKGAAWFDLSTNSVSTVRRLHAKLAPQGVDFLDAPVSGGPAGAASGKLAVWISGDKAAFDRYSDVLNTMSDQARYIGRIGAGTIAKLVHNMAATALSSIIAEAFTMGVKAGVEPLPLWEAIRQGAMGRSRTFDQFGLRVLPGRFDTPSFQLRLVHKDVALAVQLAREVEVPMRLCNLVLEEITEAMNRGWAGRDSQSFTLLQQERAGIPTMSVPLEQIKTAQTQG
jgi:3-hydroxyisobutyrate dehydrogenase-like beta-hydroxyacid dehydrogenase